MAGIDLTTANAHLTSWLTAETAVAAGQAYTIGNRTMRLADLQQIREQIQYWDGMVQRLTANSGQRGIRVRGVTPC
jgi:hypothetical protein